MYYLYLKQKYITSSMGFKDIVHNFQLYSTSSKR